MNMASNELNHKVYNEDLSDISLPRIPLVLKLCCLTNKGSRIFYKTLQMRENYSSSTVLSESRWSEALETNFSVSVWDKIWLINKNPLIPNKMKWMQLQVNRYVLPTTTLLVSTGKIKYRGAHFAQKIPTGRV